MKSETIAVLQLFQDRRQYRVPFYQRAYVWNREDQWERLWTDIAEKAEDRLAGGSTSPHFLGAVVLEPQPRKGLLGVEALHIIDGQQRLTTLQYVLAALAMVLRADGNQALLSLVEACIGNANPTTMEEPDVEVFKVWPTFRDRDQYKAVMTASNTEELRKLFPNSFTQTGSLRKVGIDHPPALEATWYFQDKMDQWIAETDGPTRPQRLSALSESVLRDFNIVSIALGEEDDAQIIFETLNGHGAQLHATDLIRNFVFMRADREGPGAGDLYDTLWSPLEGAFWVEDQRRGRLRRPRLEWFMQAVLQSELRDDIDVSRLYVGYRRFAIGGARIVPAGRQLQILNAYSELYRQLILGTGESPIAKYGREIASWDGATTHPLALMIAESPCSAQEQDSMFGDIASYLVRRAICGLTPKGYNKIFVQQMKRLAETSVSRDSLRKALTTLEGEASRWPRDDEFRKSWLDAAVYPSRLDAPRAKSLLARLERGLRSPQSEEPAPLALESLDVDHVLPQSWFEHWSLGDGAVVTQSDAQASLAASYSDQPLSLLHAAIRRREVAKAKIGNLTLLHYGVNRGLQNHGFARKREALFKVSNLHLNRKLMQLSAWDEDAIDERGRELFEVARLIWGGPE